VAGLDLAVVAADGDDVGEMVVNLLLLRWVRRWRNGVRARLVAVDYRRGPGLDSLDGGGREGAWPWVLDPSALAAVLGEARCQELAHGIEDRSQSRHVEQRCLARNVSRVSELNGEEYQNFDERSVGRDIGEE